MKILIVGNHSTFVRQLINTVRKADWEVYLLVGKTGSDSKPPKVFEQFLFPYGGESIADVLSSVTPDVVLFMGLYDACFDWSNLQQASLDYLSGLVNLLNACDDHPNVHFFYLSSQEVFSPIQGDVNEAVEPMPTQERGLLIEQGERLVLERRRVRKLDATIIRLDHPYMRIKDSTEYKDLFECMCIEACADRTITLPAHEHRFSGIYLNDAAEGIYRLMVLPRRRHEIYHLSSDETLTERELAEQIKASLGGDVAIVEAEDDDVPEGGLHLLCDNAKEEIGFRCWYPPETSIPLLCEHTRKRINKLRPDLKERRRHRSRLRHRASNFFRHLRPFLLNIVGLAAAIAIESVLKRGGYTENLDVLLLYSLLFAGVFGKQQAVFSALLSVVYRFVSTDEIFYTMINYNTYLWVAEIFIVAMLVGHLRDQLETIKVESEEEVSTVSRKLREMCSINESNKRIKLVYEKRLVEYNGSLGMIYKVTSELNALQPGEVLFSACRAIGEVMSTKDVAIYAVANDRYCRLFSASSEKARQLGRSIVYPELTDLYQSVMEHRVFINKKLDPSLPLMANGIFEGEKLTFLIMIWGLPLESLSLYQANQLSILCFLIMLSFSHASSYLNALENQRFNGGTRLLTADAFTELLNLYLRARSQKLVEFTLLRVFADDRSPSELGERLNGCMRASDMLGLRENGDVCILLPNTTALDAPVVIKRITDTGLRCTIDEQEG